VDSLRSEGLPHGLMRDVAATITFAALASALAVGCGVGVAIFVRANRDARAALLARMAGLGYAIPGVALALGLLPLFAVFDRASDVAWRAIAGAPLGLILIGSGAAVVFALAIRFLAIAIGGVEAGLARLSPNLDGAARTLGMRERELWRAVQWPLVRPALAAAALLVFIDAAKELPATLLLRPIGVETLATSLYGGAARGQFEEGAVHALLILLIGLAAALRLARDSARSIKGP
ncbi:MAG: ABC transporter permease subunit, partial [Beijerinckiaceae bacterium]